MLLGDSFAWLPPLDRTSSPHYDSQRGAVVFFPQPVCWQGVVTDLEDRTRAPCPTGRGCLALLTIIAEASVPVSRCG